MGIDRAAVKHIARLARLQLSASEEEHLAQELGRVLGYIDRLRALDVEGLEPLSFAGEATTALPLRDDVPLPCLPREAVLAQAPAQDGQSFLVPRILE